MLGHVSYLKAILPSSGPHLESLSAIEEGGRRASVMTQQILNFSRYESGEKSKKVDVNEAVQKTLILLRGAISPSYKIEITLSEEKLYATATEGGLAQIVVNLVINARDALDANGQITVSTAREDNRDRVIKIYQNCGINAPEENSKSFLKLSIHDTGHGIPEELLGKIFEPYFSTKEENGTGLGLATVKAILTELNGCIEVKSQVGVGTEMSCYLPLNEEKVDQENGDATKPQLPTGSEAILVVDDESAIRSVLSMSLEHLGYQVEIASGGVIALEKYAKLPGHYQLVILDMLMPHLSGDKVFHKLREINSGIKVLIMSGYSSEGSVKAILEAGATSFIQKPFTIEELAHKVRETLDS
jgi:CheY-like chemotaxis protein